MSDIFSKINYPVNYDGEGYIRHKDRSIFLDFDYSWSKKLSYLEMQQLGEKIAEFINSQQKKES